MWEKWERRKRGGREETEPKGCFDLENVIESDNWVENGQFSVL